MCEHVRVRQCERVEGKALSYSRTLIHSHFVTIPKIIRSRTMPTVIIDGIEVAIGEKERLNGIQAAERAGRDVAAAIFF